MEGNIISKVRALRKRSTPSERQLWEYLRNRRFLGLKFKRQYPIKFDTAGIGKFNFFIADFYCHEKRLVIELDGKIHEQQKEYDQDRDEILNALGLTVVRIENEQLEDIQRVLDILKNIA